MHERTLKQRLWALATRKQAEWEARPDLVACAMTGSLARGTVWPGSDLDFNGFWMSDEDDFEDGVEEGIYWEIDVRPLNWLQIDADALLRPPVFGPDVFGDTPLEVLWCARVLFDRDGALERAVDETARLASDRDWLQQRAGNYLAYAETCLRALADEPATRAILDARRIAIAYGVTAYWMQRGALLASAIRIPERLADHPAIQALLCGIFNLDGQRGWDAFFAAYQTMPPSVREEADPDVFREILPAVKLGMANGGLCHFRFIAEGWLPLDLVEPLMGFEPDREAQRQRVLAQTQAFLEQISLVQPYPLPEEEPR